MVIKTRELEAKLREVDGFERYARTGGWLKFWGVEEEKV